jgi:peptidoglycan/xylan/chitin deacetylase (PgdA/CDA1 family)
MARIIVGAVVLIVGGMFALGLYSYSGAVSSVEVEEKVVALTYDDGPNPPHTGALLQLLAQENVRATFFLKGQNVDAFPDDALAIVTAGHEVANHSYKHRPMTTLSKNVALAEIMRAEEAIYSATGVKTDLFRPPFGVQSIGVKRALLELNKASILMTAHGTDWEVFDPQQIADSILADVQPGGIILLHDGHGDVDDPHKQEGRAGSVDATRIIIESLRSRGYRFLTVGELLSLGEAK